MIGWKPASIERFVSFFSINHSFGSQKQDGVWTVLSTTNENIFWNYRITSLSTNLITVNFQKKKPFLKKKQYSWRPNTYHSSITHWNLFPAARIYKILFFIWGCSAIIQHHEKNIHLISIMIQRHSVRVEIYFLFMESNGMDRNSTSLFFNIPRISQNREICGYSI